MSALPHPKHMQHTTTHFYMTCLIHMQHDLKLHVSVRPKTHYLQSSFAENDL